MRIYTVHEKDGYDLRVIPDRLDPLAFILPPVWLIWHRLWLCSLGLIAIVTAISVFAPLAIPAVTYGVGAILALEGGSIKRLELRLRGWREVGVVEARTEEGAEELFLGMRAPEPEPTISPWSMP